jgi:hypothetical protein
LPEVASHSENVQEYVLPLVSNTYAILNPFDRRYDSFDNSNVSPTMSKELHTFRFNFLPLLEFLKSENFLYATNAYRITKRMPYFDTVIC